LRPTLSIYQQDLVIIDRKFSSATNSPNINIVFRLFHNNFCIWLFHIIDKFMKEKQIRANRDAQKYKVKNKNMNVMHIVLLIRFYDWKKKLKLY